MPDTEKLVTIRRLETLLNAYGAAPDYWPEEERAAAAVLIETSPQARILVKEAAALDSLLDTIPEPEVSAALASRVRSMPFPAVERQAGRLFAWLTDLLQPETQRAWQGAVAMAGVVGIVAGIGVSPLVLDRASPTPPVVAAAPPVTNVAAVSLSNDTGIDGVSLSPNVNSLSLTGEHVAGNGSEHADDGEFTVARVPLY